MLLLAAMLLVPGCFAEETPMNESANVSGVIVTAVETEAPVTDVVDGANTTGVAPVKEETNLNTTYTADVNVTSMTMAINETALISLKENPTTGYSWNVTNSSGLEIVNSTYTMDAAREGMVGVGGVHDWIVKAVETGNQTFTAVMMHVSEPATGNEDTYSLNVTVE